MVQSLIAWAAAAVLAFGFQRRVAGAVVAGVGACLFLAGLFLPAAFLCLERAARRLGDWVGTALTWLILVPFFYLSFVPGRILIACAGRDPLRRRKDPAARTYWDDCVHPRDPESYTRQY